MNISIITICFNAADDLKKTIKSVRAQVFNDYEYIVVDGGSKDATSEIIKSNADVITKWVSEPDKGIYDAMNKGIKMATGDWVIMMNAGDVFADSDVLQNVFSHVISDKITFLYGDTLSKQKNGKLLRRITSWKDGNVNHQAVIYRRKLHEEHGLYIVTKKIIISDYLFFIRIPEEQVLKLDLAISINDPNGISNQGNWARQQALCADVVFRRRSFWGMVKFYCWKEIKGILPTSFKDKIKLSFGILTATVSSLSFFFKIAVRGAGQIS